MQEMKNALLLSAVHSGHAPCVMLAIRQGADVNAFHKTEVPDRLEMEQTTALRVASSLDMVEVVDVLIERGADVNLNKPPGRTPLMAAALCESIATVRKLIDAGADLNQLDKDGNTALHLTIKKFTNYTDDDFAIGLLIEAGTDVDIPDSQGKHSAFFSSGVRMF